MSDDTTSQIDRPTQPSLFKRMDNFMRGVANGMYGGGADTIAAFVNTTLEKVAGAIAPSANTMPEKSDKWPPETFHEAFNRNLAQEQARTVQAALEGQETNLGTILGTTLVAWRLARLLGFSGGRYAALRKLNRVRPPAHPVTRAKWLAEQEKALNRTSYALFTGTTAGTLMIAAAKAPHEQKKRADAEAADHEAQVERAIRSRSPPSSP